jgi:hypothetical protein
LLVENTFYTGQDFLKSSGLHGQDCPHLEQSQKVLLLEKYIFARLNETSIIVRYLILTHICFDEIKMAALGL